jgi:hypothetical protein
MTLNRNELTPSETLIRDAFRSGQTVDLRTGDVGDENPEQGDKWGSDRTVRAELLIQLLTSADPQSRSPQAMVSLGGARVTGQLKIAQSSIAGLVLNGCYIEEPVTLFECNAPTLRILSSRLPGLQAAGLQVHGDLDLSDSHFSSEVDLRGSTVGGRLLCSSATFLNPGDVAFNAAGITVASDTYLDEGFTAEGDVELSRAQIKGRLACRGGKFSSPNGSVLRADRLKVDQDMYCDHDFAADEVILNQAHIGGYYDAKESWPLRLGLDGLVYDHIEASPPISVRDRLMWLHRAESDSLQPYDQLAKTFREAGQQRAARTIAVARERKRYRGGDLSFSSKLVGKLYGLALGYGYLPWRLVAVAGIVFLCNIYVFSHAQSVNAMLPVSGLSMSPKVSVQSCTSNYPCFRPVVYSLELLLPVVNLHQRQYWVPDAKKHLGEIYWAFVWTSVVLGWIVATGVLGGLTGLVRKE